jgi:hypothetical protein
MAPDIFRVQMEVVQAGQFRFNCDSEIDPLPTFERVLTVDIDPFLTEVGDESHGLTRLFLPCGPVSQCFTTFRVSDVFHSTLLNGAGRSLECHVLLLKE